MMASDFDITRYLSANIKHMIYQGKRKKTVKKRWVVFQGNSNTKLFQLKLYKDDTERVLKTSYTLNSENFVGTERGEIRRKNVGQSSYFAILLRDDTVIFGLDIENNGTVEGSTFAEWGSIFDDIFQSESWVVHPKRGLQTTDLRIAFYCTRYTFSVGTLDPPKCLRQWPITDLDDCRVEGDLLIIYLEDESQEPIEVKCDEWEATNIRQTLLKFMREINGQPTTTQPTDMEPDRYTEAPSSVAEKLAKS